MISSDKFVSFGYVEDSIRQRIVEWMNKIIEDEKLPFDRADAQIEIKLPDGSKRKFPDIVIWKDRLRKPVCLIELKQPSWGPTDWYVTNDAQSKSIIASPQVPYFAACNINELILWKTFEEEALSWEERRKGIYHLAKIKNLREIDYPEVETKFRESLKRFLRDLVEIYIEKKVLPTVPIDEFFIYSLRTVVDSLYFPITVEIEKLFKTEVEFRKGLIKWFVSQGWNAPSTDEDFEKIARQFLYLLMNKVMFYNTLRKVKKIKDLQIPETIEDGNGLKQELQRYFDIAKEATEDYETIFGFDFLEKIPIPNDVVSSLISFLNGFSRYDFTKLGYKDLGHVFDRLIPNDERHTLGQYYTNPDVVDIINTFCIRDVDEKVADFGCGAGTFLVRAYARIKYLNPSKTHGEILNQIIGGDISKFAAHLSMINLASRDLSKVENYPLVLCKDFFDIIPSTAVRWPKTSKETIETLSGKKVKVELPSGLDVVVGNPPYTRQEELETYVEDYKEKLQEILVHDWGKKIKLGLRVGLHGYFFLHGLRFLANGGRFGYITSNSWLDVDYGKYLQGFFLNNCKIVTIIEPKERVFPDADINTVITILERCDDKKERERNSVKFVRLKIPLKELIFETEDDKRFGIIERLVKRVENTNKLYEDDKLRIYPKLQAELLEEVGFRWSRYIRAPEILYKVLRKQDLMPLKEVVDIRWGNFKTGVDEFFYLTEDEINKHKIEKEFLEHKVKSEWASNYVIKSPRESKSILIHPQTLKYRVLLVHKEKKELRGTQALKYIQLGVAKGFDSRPTCASRGERWYDLGYTKPAPILWPGGFWERFIVFYNPHCTFADRRLFTLSPTFRDRKLTKALCGILNSTLTFLFAEIFEKTVFGQGLLLADTYAVKKIPIPNLKSMKSEVIEKIVGIFEKISTRDIGSIFKELGAGSPEEFVLNRVESDRRELDKIVMGEVLGLTEEEQIEVYKAVLQLVKERIEKSRSVEKRKKVSGADPQALAEGILREIDTSELKKFPDDYISDYEYEIRNMPEGQPELGSDLRGFFVKVGDERISCASSDEAQWIYHTILNGITSIKIPKNNKIIKDTLKEYTTIFKRINRKIETSLEDYIPDRKLKEKVRTIIYKKLFSNARV